MAHSLRKPTYRAFEQSPVAPASANIGEAEPSRLIRSTDLESLRETATDRKMFRRGLVGVLLTILLLLAVAAGTGHLVAGLFIVACASGLVGLLVKWGTWVLDNTPAW